MDVSAQQKCGIEEYNELRKKQNPKLETQEQFEKWMKKEIKSLKSSNKNRQEAEVVTIPVVVHIVHNGESVGTGKNIPDEQIFSQIEVLNEDFRRLNEDRDNTPLDFEPVAADIEINFELAQRDPEGLPTNGIQRVNGGKDLWFIAENYTLKALSYWPAEDYLNIWVTDLGDGFLGLAQFPVSTLDGLEEASNSRLTDGIMVDFRAFGSILKFPAGDINPSYNAGRTATHEVGHFFGLRHIWGDGGCSVDDFCDDTPVARRDNGGLSLCTYPGPNSCTDSADDLPDMFQNYMDYTDDVCMNLFTQDQKSRMRIVLDNSPRRASLKESPGITPPIQVANDLGVRTILNPTFTVCGDSFSPAIEVRNYGTNPITDFLLSVSANGEQTELLSSSNTLIPLQIDTILFDEISLAGFENGELIMTYQVQAVNGGEDGNNENDSKENTITYPLNGVTPIRTNLNTLPLNWSITNFDDLKTWEIVDAINSEANNKALSMNFFDYENEGAIDLLSSPVLDLRGRQSAELTFDIAYAKFPNADLESLTVVVSPQCVDPLTQGDTIFFKAADELATVNPTSASFVPSSIADWRSERIDLADYLNETAFQITFIAQNAFGNNLYLDNLTVEDVENRIVSPSPVTCIADQNLTLEVVNQGSTAITEFNVIYSLDGGSNVNTTLNLPQELEAGFSTTVTIDLPSIGEGEHRLEVEIDLPNLTENTSIGHSFFIDTSSDFLPIRESFSDFRTSDWQVVNHDEDITWSEGSSQGRDFLFIQNEAYQNIEEEDWLVSQSIDFSLSTTAILTFDVAYSSINTPSDALALYVSTNCGESYDIISYNKSGSNLATGEFNGNPTSANWRTEVVDLSDLTTYDDVRLAFVATNRNGNNLFIDDVQIYVTDFIAPTENILFPNPVENNEYNIRFSLDKKESVDILLYDRNGRILQSYNFPSTLNQLYTFDISNQIPGLYLVKIVGESFTTTKRLVKLN